MKTRQLAVSAVVAAAYAALTIVLAPISYGPVQFRVAEALCVLPFICPTSAWGLFIGCIIANIYGGYGALDIVFGSLATLFAGLVTARTRIKWLAPLPPVIFNGLIVGALLSVTLVPENSMGAFPGFAAWVGLGEAVVCYALGLPLLFGLSKLKFFSEETNNPF